jgi:hypothetical protein
MIRTKDIPIYYINPDFFDHRRKMMDSFLDEAGLVFERVASNSSHELRQTRICEGLIKAAKRGIENAVYPFLILEDDARLTKALPERINIPEDARLIYWGVSLWECGGVKAPLKIREYDSDYYRLYNSLSCHAILIPNQEGANHFIKINSEAIKKLDYSDIWLAVESQKETYLTPKDGPYFYQNDSHTQPITNFSWDNIKDQYIK